MPAWMNHKLELRLPGEISTTSDMQMIPLQIKRHLLLGRKAVTNLDSILKSRDIICNEGPSCQSYGFPSGHVWMWELDYKESWALKNWRFWTMVLEKTLESPLDYKEIKPVHPKGNQSWIFIGKTDAEAETPILLPPDARNWPIRKILKLGKIEGRRRRGQQGIRWHQWLDRHEFEQALGVGDGQEAWRVTVHGVAKSWKIDLVSGVWET